MGDGRGVGGRVVNRFVEYCIITYIGTEAADGDMGPQAVPSVRVCTRNQCHKGRREEGDGGERKRVVGVGGGGVGEAGGLWLNNSDPVVDTAAAAPGTTGAGSRHTSRSSSLALFLLSLAPSLSLSLVSRLSPHSRDVRTFLSHHRSVRVFSSAARSPPTRLTSRRIGRGREESSLFRTLARSHWLCCTDQLVSG